VDRRHAGESYALPAPSGPRPTWRMCRPKRWRGDCADASRRDGLVCRLSRVPFSNGLMNTTDILFSAFPTYPLGTSIRCHS
jgi:hypothetical protein